MATLRSFLEDHRTKESDWNLTGMGKDVGRYKVPDEEYDTFLHLVNTHIFGSKQYACSLLEKHREIGPLLIDLDFRYPSGGPLVRRFTDAHIRTFLTQYIAALVYFSEVEHMTEALHFYVMVKPSAEGETAHHKDGIHIQCQEMITHPKFQFGIRGFALQEGILANAFQETGVSNPQEDCFDVSVIHKNNWFLYGACKPNKQQYKVISVYTLSPEAISTAFHDASEEMKFSDVVEMVEKCLTTAAIPDDTEELIKKLSIRRGMTEATTPAIRDARAKEWADLQTHWGSGKATATDGSIVSKIVPNIVEDEERMLTVSDFEETRRVTSKYSAEDIALAHRIARQCLNPERRARKYEDWINLAICLRNISDSDESFRVWVEISRRVPGYDSTMSDEKYREKWDLLKTDETNRLTMGSLIYWAKDDAPESYKAIQSETNRDWILNFGKDTHVNVATLVCRLYGHEFRCSIGAKRSGHEWFQFVGHSWKHLRTANELRARLSSDVRNNYIAADLELGKRITVAAEAEKEILEKKRKKIFDIERQLEMASFKDNVLKECAEKFYDEDFLPKLNCDPYIVGVANGVLELQHFSSPDADRPHVLFRPGRPEDNVSFLMGRSEPDLDAISYIPYDPNSQEQKDIAVFFEKIYPDTQLREYVLTLLSSCLEGQNREQRFYVNQGAGSNGKSMTQTLMRYTFGDYQTSLQTTALTRKRPESGAANPDMIVTKCKRYIYMGEPDQNEKLNTSRMKQLSGEDIVEARGLFSEQEKFKMMGKIFLACNDLPPVSSMDDGTWRRLRVIPHISTFVDPNKPADPTANIYHKDLHLEHKLRKWRTSFLSLLVHYYETRYLAGGMQEPACVLAASAEYKEQNDTFHSFVQENFVLEPGAGPVRITEVMECYRDWKATQYGRGELKRTEITDRLRKICDRKSTQKEFWGIRRMEADEESVDSLLSAANMP
jgi:P4 family phage/plasmid primase-like protien